MGEPQKLVRAQTQEPSSSSQQTGEKGTVRSHSL